MKQFDCPLLGWRPASEFTCAGAAINGLRETDTAQVRHGVYFGDATARIKMEWWFHRPSALWFHVTRDTATDSVLAVALASHGGERHGA